MRMLTKIHDREKMLTMLLMGGAELPPFFVF